jgi:hypothetical protein
MRAHFTRQNNQKIQARNGIYQAMKISATRVIKKTMAEQGKKGGYARGISRTSVKRTCQSVCEWRAEYNYFLMEIGLTALRPLQVKQHRFCSGRCF